ncbi:hypothetical protein [Maribacter sp. 2308TA10-17]|uniref:hypothetical protein n=1 Tax=Maribacter sp. 2308TA10-17 TaxID=3386276 RepID=UPI0039BD8D1B
MKKLLLIFVIALMGCSSTEMVENWKNPDIVIFDANKVLLVGMSNDEEARTNFETKLQKEFEARNVEAVRSLDVFDVKFTDSKRTEKELDDLEQSLLDKDFDAILLTKIIGSESRQSFRKSVNDLYKSREGFNEDYRRYQDIYYEDEYYDTYTVYNAETSLYCICVGKERSLIWRGNIDILDPDNVNKTIKDYVRLIVVAMEEQDLIFRKEEKNEVTNL